MGIRGAAYFGYIMIYGCVRGGVKSGDGWKEMTALRAAVPSYTQKQGGLSRALISKHTPRQFKYPLHSSLRSIIPIRVLFLAGLHAFPFLSHIHEVPKAHALSLHGNSNMACQSPFLHIRTSPAFSPSSLFRPPKYPWFSSYLFRHS